MPLARSTDRNARTTRRVVPTTSDELGEVYDSPHRDPGDADMFGRVSNEEPPTRNGSTQADSEDRTARLERMVEALALQVERLTHLTVTSAQVPLPARGTEQDHGPAIHMDGEGFRASSNDGASTTAKAAHLDQIARGLMSSIPKYDGKGGPAKLQSFVTKFESFLDYAGDLPPTAAVTIAASKMIDAADIWWSKHIRQFAREDPGRIRCWMDFKKQLTAKFMPPEYEDEVRNQIFQLRQSDFPSVTAYIDAFNVLHMQLLSGSEDRLYVQRFVQGLKRQIRESIISHRDNLVSLDASQEAARRYEQLSQSLDPQRIAAHTASTPGKPKTTSMTFTNRHGKVIDKSKVTCFKCNKKGHFQSECPQEKANMADDNDKATSDDGTESEPERQVFAAYAAVSGLRDGGTTCMRAQALPTTANELIIDCGATRHMVPSRTAFKNLLPASGSVGTAGSQELRILGKGVAQLRIDDGIITLNDCLYVPALRRPLLSISAARTQGLEFFFRKNGIVEVYKNDGLVARAADSGGLFLFTKNGGPIAAVAAASTSMPISSLWHQRLTHVGIGSTLRAQEYTEGLPKGNLQLHGCCEPCALAKQTRSPFPQSTTSHTLGTLVHADIAGPFPSSIDGNIYVLNYTEHHSRFIHSYFLNSKNSRTVLACFKNFQARIRTQCGTEVRIHRSDGGGEFVSQDFDDYLSEHGIQRQLSVRDTPAQNGIAERSNRTILERVRATLIAAGLPDRVWDEIWAACVHVYNRIPHTATRKPPIMTFSRSAQAPNLEHLRILGSVAYSHVLKHQRDSKLSPAAERLILIGYSECAKAYRLWDPTNDSVLERRDVTVDEEVTYLKSGMPTEKLVSQFGNTELPARPPTETQEQFSEETAPVEDVLTFITTTGDPATCQEAMSTPEKDSWRAAMKKELESIAQNHVWTLVPRPADTPVITGKWVYRTKRKPTGEIDKYKARYVARGFTQTHGVDFFDTFSPVVPLHILRMFLAIATSEGWTIHQGDVVTAYLQSELDVPVFMEQPQGSNDPRRPADQWVCKLNKALYGLRQSGRLWNETIVDFARTRGFAPLKLEPCVLFKKRQPDSDSATTLSTIAVIMLIYVDDIVLLGPVPEDIAAEERALAARFTMSAFTPIHHLLGIHINSSESGITLTQEAYALRVLERFGMSESRAQDTPMDANLALGTFDGTATLSDRRKFQEIIGSLMYLSLGTRPDMTAAVNMLGRFASNPGPEHFVAAKRVLRYLKATANWGLAYPKESDFNLKTFVDADWAGDTNSRKSTSGLIVFLGKAAIHWRSTLQSSVARSSTEAEYLAASMAGQETMGIVNVLGELLGDCALPVPELLIDNNGARQSIEGETIKRRSKHIDVHAHYIRDLVHHGKLRTNRVDTTANTADCMTKALPRPRLQECRAELGMMERPKPADSGRLP